MKITEPILNPHGSQWLMSSSVFEKNGDNQSSALNSKLHNVLLLFLGISLRTVK